MPFADTKKSDDDLIIVTNAFDLIENYYVDPVDSLAIAQKGVDGMEAYLRSQDITFSREGMPQSQASSSRSKAIGYLSSNYGRLAKIAGANAGALQYAAVNEMVKSLDSYTTYLTPELLEDLKTLIEGAYFGLGIEVALIGDEIAVVSPVDDTPAARAGLKPGDRIAEINDISTEHMTVLDAYKMLRGPLGTEVKLTIRRKGTPKPMEFSIVRQLIEIRQVKHRLMADGIGYVRIPFVHDDITKELKHALAGFGKKESLKGLIIDMRSNPGGLLEESIAVCDLFMKSGTIVVSKGRAAFTNRVYKAYDQGDEPSCPIVILINEGTASASELVAFALHNNRRAVLVGTRTFGKAIIQSVTEFNDGSALQLTIARYYSSEGVTFNEEGVYPDLYVRQAPSGAEDASRGNNSSVTKKTPYDTIPVVDVPPGDSGDAAISIAHSILTEWVGFPSQDWLRQLAEKALRKEGGY